MTSKYLRIGIWTLWPMLIVIIGVSCQFPIESVSVMDFRIGPERIVSGDGFQFAYAPLGNFEQRDDSTFIVKRYTSIREIDNIGFQLWITNTGNTPTAFAMYASSVTDPRLSTRSSIESDGVLIFDGPEVPPQATAYIDWPSSMAYVRNRRPFYRLARNEKMMLYFLSDEPLDNVRVDSLTMIVTASIEGMVTSEYYTGE